jgi:hypothetical protein
MKSQSARTHPVVMSREKAVTALMLWLALCGVLALLGTLGA